MNDTINISEAKIYVGTYAKYNGGSIFGKWLDLSDYSDIEEFYEACAALHADEGDPEYMFQDYEEIPRSLISESWLSKNFFPFRDAVENLEQSHQEPFNLWLNNGGYDLNKEDADELINRFQQDYVGAYDSEEDFAREYIETNYDLPEIAITYFDYEYYANDLFKTSYWFDGGHVFNNS